MQLTFRAGLATALVAVHVSVGAHQKHGEPHHHPHEPSAAHHESSAGHRQHGAHVHGEGVLNLVTEGQTLLVELATPAHNLLGFEHEPRTSGERQAVSAVLADLESIATLVALPDYCRQEESVVEWPGWAEDGHNHAEHHHLDHHPEHHEADHQRADFLVRYTLRCRSAFAPRALGFPLFERFPAFERLRVQWLLAEGSGAAVVTASQPRLRY